MERCIVDAARSAQDDAEPVAIPRLRPRIADMVTTEVLAHAQAKYAAAARADEPLSGRMRAALVEAFLILLRNGWLAEGVMPNSPRRIDVGDADADDVEFAAMQCGGSEVGARLSALANRMRAAAARVAEPRTGGGPRMCATSGHERVPADFVGVLDDGVGECADVAYCIECRDAVGEGFTVLQTLKPSASGDEDARRGHNEAVTRDACSDGGI